MRASLANIFNHYTELAIYRRREHFGHMLSIRGTDSHLVDIQSLINPPSKETSTTTSASNDLTGIDNHSTGESTKSAKKLLLAKLSKPEIGYKEFLQFIADFRLKSSRLLTAIQLGDIYFSTVKLDEESLLAKDMEIHQFIEALLKIALMAFRTPENPTSTSTEKCKALLLYMWKAINDSDIRNKAVIVRGANTAQTHSGSLNYFGSGLFNEDFLKIWQGDQFRNYTFMDDENVSTGEMVFDNILEKIGTPKK